MKISDGIKQAYDRQWSMINTFTVQINTPPAVQSEVGTFTDDINLNIISVSTPDFVNDPIEAFIANRWFIHNGKDQLYRFSITFRDQNQMSLYRSFLKIYNMSKTNYFDDVAMSIIISKDADWFNESDKILMELGGTMIEGISNLDFSNDTENQIAEFTISFKSTTPIINN
ncbi:hypothetical protein [Vibrio phage phiKT1024]|nr:hypothetical protein [Vibrio phage phiKT1024]